MPAPYRTIWTWFLFGTALAVCTAPLLLGLELQERWLQLVGWVVLDLFVMGCFAVTMEKWRRERQEREDKMQGDL
jgi:hypothetical protein